MGVERRRVLVWGAGSAVGRACVAAAESQGHELVLVDRDDSPGHGDALLRLSVDPLDEAAASGVAAAVADLGGGLDALVDCSAAMELWPAELDSAARMTAVLAGNVTAPWIHVRALAAALAAGRSPAVVLLGSIDGLRANPHVPAYSAAKAGTAALTRALAAELGPDGVRVNCVAASGVVQTSPADGHLRRPTGDAALADSLTPLGRRVDATEVASVAMFLASPEASGVSGVVLPVDGGRIAVTPGTWQHPDPQGAPA